MKSTRTLLLILSLTMTGLVAVAQITQLSNFRLTPHGAGNLGSRSPLPVRTQEPRLPATASPDIIWVQCPPEAQSLGATCGRLPVPLHHRHPNKEKIRVYFELYLHTNAGGAESAILANTGGPGVTTTGFRAFWLAMFAPNMDVHDVLLIDDRGRGMSQAIDCKPLQHGLGPTLDDEIAACAAQLGDDASSYSTGDIALDTDAVRAALGYDKVDYYGASAAGTDVMSYVTRFGAHLRSLILDSPWAQPELLPHGGPLVSPGIVTSIRVDCLGSPTCSIDHGDPDSETTQLIGAVRQNPVQGYAYDASGNLVYVNIDEALLWSLMTNATGGASIIGCCSTLGNYISTGEVLAAYDALSQGDSAPLLRLGAEGLAPLVSDSGDPRFFSYGAVTGLCVLVNGVYDWSAPLDKRFLQFADSVADLPDDYFAPFSKAAATDEANDASRKCINWEEPTRPLPLVPRGATYPTAPTLVLTSDMDPVVPEEAAREVAALFPNSTFVVLKDAAHAPGQDNYCALGLLNNLIETLQPGDTSCQNTIETVWPAVGRFPMVSADARPANVDPDGNNEIGIAERQVVTVAVATAIDALKRSQIGSGNGVGLRAGAFSTNYSPNGQTTTLTNCAFAYDVTVNGTVTWGSDFSFVADLTVSGTGTAGGTLHVEGTWEALGPVGNFKISGTLGGKNVAVLVPEA